MVDSAKTQRLAELARDYPESLISLDAASLCLTRDRGTKRLAILAPPGDPLLALFSGVQRSHTSNGILMLCPLDAENAAALRSSVSWLRPVPLGLTTSFGFGDRLGLATPGHVHALRECTVQSPGIGIAPIFAQQSIREMSRTARTPIDVMIDATWGAFEAGWRGPVGADADHLKTLDDINATVAAGYSFYTIDPSEYVDDEADKATSGSLHERLAALPWVELDTSLDDLRQSYALKPFELEDREILVEPEALVRAAVKYGGAIAHVSRMYRHLASKGIPFELEMSVDETESPTSHAEHVYIAGELRRLRVRWVSLAPRFVGRFEKGIDYVGDLAALRSNLEGHAAITRALGPYKLSLHSGSDKFSVYPLMQEAAGGLTHVKTAGTSYLEALRVTAQTDQALFRTILSFARDRYGEDRATYLVSADLSRVPYADDVPDDRLPDLMEDTDARQVLHVTFGSVLAEFRPALIRLLQEHASEYDDTLRQHFSRHLAPFAQPSRGHAFIGKG